MKNSQTIAANAKRIEVLMQNEKLVNEQVLKNIRLLCVGIVNASIVIFFALFVPFFNTFKASYQAKILVEFSLHLVNEGLIIHSFYCKTL